MISENVQATIAAQQHNKEPGKVVYIGAGSNPSLLQWQVLKQQQWVLAEAEPDSFARLQKRYKNNKAIALVNAVIAEQDQKNSEFFVCSPARLSSRYKPLELHQRMPNLSCEKTTQPALSVNALLQQREVLQQPFNLLVIDTNGGEAQLLNGLSEQQLNKFNVVLINTPKANFYSGTRGEDAVKQSLNKHCFNLVVSESSALHTTQLWQHDEQKQTIKKLTNERNQALSRAQTAEKERDESVARVHDASKKLEQLQQNLNQQTERAKNAEKERDESVARVHDASKKLEQLQQTLNQQTERAKAEEQKRIDTEKELETTVARVHDASNQLDQLKQQLSDQTERAKIAEAKKKELEQTAKDANEESEKHINWAHNLEAELEQANKVEEQLTKERDEAVTRVHDASKELKEQQRSAQLSTKLLAKVEADASELRERYAEKVKSEQELKDLIKELHAKLQAASHFYHKLEQEHPELLEKL